MSQRSNRAGPGTLVASSCTCDLTPGGAVGPAGVRGGGDGGGRARHNADEQVGGAQVEEAAPRDGRDLLRAPQHQQVQHVP